MKKGMGISLFLATFFLVAVEAQDLCLPMAMVELDVHVVVLRSSEADLCSNSGLKERLQRAAIQRYRPPNGTRCQIESFSQRSCEITSTSNGRYRMTLGLRTNLTCGSTGCMRHTVDQERRTIDLFKSHETQLRTAMRASRKISFRLGDTRLRIVYFNGRKGNVIQHCRDSTTVSSLREKLTLCGCPEDCPTPAPTMSPQEQECAAQGMVYSNCGTACPATCESQEPVFCTLQCVPGCVCPEGQVLDGTRCVRPDRCLTARQRACAARGMVHMECGSSCPPTCDDPDRTCISLCSEGCFCPSGMLLQGTRCVRPHQCQFNTTRRPPTGTPPTRPPRGTPRPKNTSCPGLKVYDECGSSCAPSCDNPAPSFCTEVCKIGCFCPPGMVEHPRNRSACIILENCPPTRPRTNSTVCPAGKTFQECATACPPTCDNPNPQLCTLQCRRGCFCPPGTVEHPRNRSACITLENCPPTRPRTNSTVCPAGKTFQECATACPPTCDNPNPQLCTLQCRRGCFCPPGTVEHPRNRSACITLENCPPTRPATNSTVCPFGKVFQECGTACPPTCDNPGPTICTRQCVRGCFCPAGTVEHPRNKSVCIAPDQCPAVCPSGMVFQTCGTACPQTCDTPRPTICTLQCVRGCFCPQGKVLKRPNSCVDLSECESEDKDEEDKDEGGEKGDEDTFPMRGKRSARKDRGKGRKENADDETSGDGEPQKPKRKKQDEDDSSGDGEEREKGRKVDRERANGRKNKNVADKGNSGDGENRKEGKRNKNVEDAEGSGDEEDRKKARKNKNVVEEESSGDGVERKNGRKENKKGDGRKNERKDEAEGSGEEENRKKARKNKKVVEEESSGDGVERKNGRKENKKGDGRKNGRKDEAEGSGGEENRKEGRKVEEDGSGDELDQHGNKKGSRKSRKNNDDEDELDQNGNKKRKGKDDTSDEEELDPNGQRKRKNKGKSGSGDGEDEHEVEQGSGGRKEKTSRKGDHKQLEENSKSSTDSEVGDYGEYDYEDEHTSDSEDATEDKETYESSDKGRRGGRRRS